MTIPFKTWERRHWLALAFGSLLAAFFTAWAFTWPFTKSPVAPFYLPKLMYMAQHHENYRAFVDAHAAVVDGIAADIRKVEPQANLRALLLAHVPDLVHYRFDAEVSGVFYRVLTPAEMEEVRARQGWPAFRGDCKAKAILTASVAENLGVPYRFGFAPMHMWVEVQHGSKWCAIDRQGRGLSPGGDLSVSDWFDAQSEVDKTARMARLRADPAESEAFFRLLRPANDPDGNNPWRDTDLRFSNKNAVVIPAGVGVLALLSVLLPVYVSDRRNRCVQAT